MAFIDYFLTDGRDSLEIIKSLQEKNSHIRVFLMSVFDIRTVAISVGVNFLKKPFSRESVRQTLLDSLKRRGK
jgi:response regulator of citrate/malate metabolism